MTTVEQRAREAAERSAKAIGHDLETLEAAYHIDSYIEGFCAATQSHEAEIAAKDAEIIGLKHSCRVLEWSAAEEVAVRMATEGRMAKLDAEIATLRQKLAEAEARAAKVER